MSFHKLTGLIVINLGFGLDALVDELKFINDSIDNEFRF